MAHPFDIGVKIAPDIVRHKPGTAVNNMTYDDRNIQKMYTLVAQLEWFAEKGNKKGSQAPFA